MATTPDQIYAKQYGSLIMMLSQQRGSRLRDAVTVKSGIVGEEAYVDQLSAFEASTRGTSRLISTAPSVAAYARRKIPMVDYYIAKGIDKIDDVRTLGDPTSSIVQSGMAGMGRRIDAEIIAAASGTASTGKVGGDNTVLPSAQKVAVGSTNLTLAKLLSGLEILNGNDVDPMDQKYCIINSAMLSSLLNTTEIKSADYNTVKALAQGEVDTFLGMKFIRTELLAGAAATKKCLLFTKTGIALGIGRDVKSRITEESTLHFAKQLYFSMAIGATRLEEDKVVEIMCNTTV